MRASPKIMKNETEHRGSKNSNIFPSVSVHAYKNQEEAFCSESQRSFGSRNGFYEDAFNPLPSDSSMAYGSQKLSKLSPMQIQAAQEAEQKVRRLGANKAFNRGLFDRYQTTSVLSGANSNGSSIDKKVAEIMAAEKKEFESKDLVMVPSMSEMTILVVELTRWMAAVVVTTLLPHAATSQCPASREHPRIDPAARTPSPRRQYTASHFFTQNTRSENSV